MHSRVVVTGSLSKCHGKPGVRVGRAITRNAELRVNPRSGCERII
jgi:aspartate/methionine/tyrosine aminotransferase